MANRTGLRWSTQEDDQIRALAAAGRSKKEAGETLGRPYHGIEYRAARLGVKFARPAYWRAWTNEADDALRALVASGAGKRTCGRHIRRSVLAIEHRVRVLGLRFADVPMRVFRQPDYVGWTRERIKQAATWWQDDVSALNIAKRLGGRISRSAVIAKMHRLGLRKPDKPKAPILPPRPIQGRPIKPTKPPGQGFVLRPLGLAHHPHGSPGPQSPPLPRATDIARVKLDELTAKHCRWVIGDPKKTIAEGRPLFCGNEREPGLPYCKAHVVRAYDVISLAPHQKYPPDYWTELFGLWPTRRDKERSQAA